MKITKIYDNEKEVYSGNYCYVNMVIFRGRIYGDFKEVGSKRDKIFFTIKQWKGQSYR